MSYLWSPISWKPRALTKADKHSHFNTHSYRQTHTHTHTHIQSKKTNILVTHWMETEEENDKSVGRREDVAFQFWLERGEWRGVPDREREREKKVFCCCFFNPLRVPISFLRTRHYTHHVRQERRRKVAAPTRFRLTKPRFGDWPGIRLLIRDSMAEPRFGNCIDIRELNRLSTIEPGIDNRAGILEFNLDSITEPFDLVFSVFAILSRHIP